jgi:hypothetical protein
MQAYPKHVKKLLREALTAAYEGELCAELTKLGHSFTEWRAGCISSGELSHRIHQYEVGPSRELFKRYNDGSPDMNVAYAIVIGVLERKSLPAELLEALAAPLSFYQSLADQNALATPDD